MYYLCLKIYPSDMSCNSKQQGDSYAPWDCQSCKY